MNTPARAISAVFGLTLLGAVVALQGAASGQQSNGQSTPAQSGATQQNAAQTEELSATASTLARQAGELDDQLDVIVTDKDGKPVRSGAGRFLCRRTEAQTIDNFSVVKLDPIETMMTSPPRDSRRR
jgi:hypothetical protein